MDALRPLLEKYGHRLSNRAHLSELIPAVPENEKDKLKKELKDVKEASVIFDGTDRLGEALAVIVRYVQENVQPTHTGRKNGFTNVCELSKCVVNFGL